MSDKKFVLKITCPDRKGIVASISTKLFELGGFILTSDQFSDPITNQFFMRIFFSIEDKSVTAGSLKVQMDDVFQKFGIKNELYDKEEKMNLLILCSKQDHCLTDLLSKWKRGALHANIQGIVSNHNDLREVADWYKIPFHHFPVSPETKESQEKQIRDLIASLKIDYVVLARYMQILSPEFCKDFNGKIINIHHSFLPGFKGANPYKQAYDRGVKIIGATAHFVTEDLDEGPIICQETIRVNHAHSSNDLAQYGSDIESLVLSRAVKYVLNHQVFINKNKTVVLK